MKDIVLGNNDFTLMIVKDSITKYRGIGIVDKNRFNTNSENGDRVDISHIQELDKKIDTVIEFSNINGLEALISELELIKLDMQIEILNTK